MHDINTFLPFWEGFSVTAIKPDGDALLIDLIPQRSRFPTCSGCHRPSTTIHEYCQRSIRDLPILGRSVRLNVELRRVGCGACGKRIESVSWLDRYSRMTKRLAEAVIQACERLPTLHVAEMLVCIGTVCACWNDERYKPLWRNYRKLNRGVWLWMSSPCSKVSRPLYPRE